MTQEQKQFIIKALQTGIPALAKDHIAALEEVAAIAEAKQEDLDGQEGWKVLNQTRHENIINVLYGSLPFMAEEYVKAYFDAVNAGQAKFNENRKIREEKEKADAEKDQGDEAPVATEKTPA